MMTRPTHLLTVLAILTLAGCGGQESSPVPQPVPFFMRKSTPGSDQTKTLVVGLAGAVAGQGRVHLRDLDSAAEASAPSSSVGTFGAVLMAPFGARLEARFEREGALSEPVALSQHMRGPHPELVATLGPNDVVSAPDAQGQVTVSNDDGPGLPPRVQATPESDVVVSDATSGAVATTRTDAAGLFTVKLPAAKGDVIQVLLVSPTSADATSDFLSYTVP